MSNFYILKLIYELYYLRFLLSERFSKPSKNSSIANSFIKFNNKVVMKRIKEKKIKKVSILLPHCIQKYSCNLKITNNIENCKKCGLCDIAELLELKEKYQSLDVKVATGGTLARLYLKEHKPDLVIAVACKRDLMSGIHDSFPMSVYGVFNEIVNTPCIDTRVSVQKIKEVLREVGLK
nr:DUF116 domain-containing protein [uncultured Cetobacterium sp.]